MFNRSLLHFQEGHVSWAVPPAGIKLHSTKGFSVRLMAKWEQRVGGEGGMLVMETQLIDTQWP